MRLTYRAIEATNTQTRRLSYISAIISLLKQDALTEGALLEKLNKWAHEKSFHILFNTGILTSTNKKSAGLRYVDLAKKLGLITTIAGMFRPTRVGITLYHLLEQMDNRRNPFILEDEEKLFFLYQLLKNDADILLTIGQQIHQNNATLSELQKSFYNNFIEHLENKATSSESDTYRRQLLERRNFISTQWKKPERYSEHIVPPRLNWMLDLGFLDIAQFNKHKCKFSENGLVFFESIPVYANNIEITDDWLDDTYWQVYSVSFMDQNRSVLWQNLDDKARIILLEELIQDVFARFQNSQIPRVSFYQAALYISILAMTKRQVVISIKAIQEWLSTPRIINNKKYEVRLSPRENESYLLASFL